MADYPMAKERDDVMAQLGRHQRELDERRDAQIALSEELRERLRRIERALFGETWEELPKAENAPDPGKPQRY